jgi:hypothetical protein
VAGNADPTMDENSALVLVTRLFYAAAGGVVMGYQCDQAPNTGGPRNGGCNADSWYMNVLAADDDDGNIANGTPHMLAIEAAFRRHGISCRVPVPMNLGCLATPAPTAKPILTATPGTRSATITWTAVPNAAEYWILRTDGVHGCAFGKTRVARVAASAPRTFTQNDLLDGFTYYYSVVPIGGVVPLDVPVESCAGLTSDCAAVTPLAPQADIVCEVPQNAAPVAINDADSAPRNHSRRVNVLANDADADFDALVVTSVTTPSSGTAVINGDNTSITYTPAPGAQIGQTATFGYQVSDGRGGSSSATATVTIGGDPCVDPLGFVVLTDPAGDSLTGSAHDVRSTSVVQTADGKFVFIMKMTDLATVPPNTTWGTTYSGADGAVRFFRMTTANQLPLAAPSFAYGNGATVTPFTVPGTVATGSSYSADGTIRVVVPGSAIGNPQPGQELQAFVTRIRLESPDGSALLPDNMPNNAIAEGRYSVVSCQ